jgi:hypothetical protein
MSTHRADWLRAGTYGVMPHYLVTPRCPAAPRGAT